jgi:hypothetical protein
MTFHGLGGQKEKTWKGLKIQKEILPKVGWQYYKRKVYSLYIFVSLMGHRLRAALQDTLTPHFLASIAWKPMQRGSINAFPAWMGYSLQYEGTDSSLLLPPVGLTADTREFDEDRHSVVCSLTRNHLPVHTFYCPGS